jgi:hypothetical protein
VKQQILEVLDKSTNNGMKADEIMVLLDERAGYVIEKWTDILDTEIVVFDELLHGVVHDMKCSMEDFNNGE